MREVILCFLLSVFASVGAFDVPSLDSRTFDEKTSGKTVFITFYAPWCAFYAWEKLAEEYDGHETGLVATVDCTSQLGKILCEYQDIRSFPTIMYGDPQNLEEYNGGRKYEELSEFAKENLVPKCSYKNLDLCDEETRKLIDSYLTMSKEELAALVAAEEQKLTDAKKKYDEELEALQRKYEEAAKARDAAIAAVRDGTLGWMKAVTKARNRGEAKQAKSASTDEL